MRQVTWTDGLGRMKIVVLPDDAPDTHAPMGAIVGPPDFDEFLPTALATRLNNELYHRHILTFKDVRRRRQDVASALMRALAFDVEAIVNIYRESENGKDSGNE